LNRNPPSGPLWQHRYQALAIGPPSVKGASLSLNPDPDHENVPSARDIAALATSVVRASA
jgi:hypothetical protein